MSAFREPRHPRPFALKWLLRKMSLLAFRKYRFFWQPRPWAYTFCAIRLNASPNCCARFFIVSVFVAKVSRALCSHEVGTRVGGFLRPLADLRNLRCRGS